MVLPLEWEQDENIAYCVIHVAIQSSYASLISCKWKHYGGVNALSASSAVNLNKIVFYYLTTWKSHASKCILTYMNITKLTVPQCPSWIQPTQKANSTQLWNGQSYKTVVLKTIRL